jgi:hypothetical protein
LNPAVCWAPLEPALPESERTGPAGLLKAGKEPHPVPRSEPNNFAAPQRPAAREPVPGLEPNNFAALRRPAVREPAPERNNSAALRRPAAQVPEPVPGSEPNNFAALQRLAARELMEPAENKKAEKGQVPELEPAQELKPADG